MVHALAAGATVSTTVDREISSKIDKAGTDLHLDRGRRRERRTRAGRDSGGLKVTLTITEIHESENKGDKTGKLTLTPSSVAIAGTELSARRLGGGARPQAARPQDQRG